MGVFISSSHMVCFTSSFCNLREEQNVISKSKRPKPQEVYLRAGVRKKMPTNGSQHRGTGRDFRRMVNSPYFRSTGNLPSLPENPHSNTSLGLIFPRMERRGLHGRNSTSITSSAFQQDTNSQSLPSSASTITSKSTTISNSSLSSVLGSQVDMLSTLSHAPVTQDVASFVTIMSSVPSSGNDEGVSNAMQSVLTTLPKNNITFPENITFSDDDDDDDHLFSTNAAACLSNIETLRLHSFKIPEKTKKRRKKRGPLPSTTKAKFYHLPDASRIPKFRKLTNGSADPLLLEHINSGYGFPRDCYNFEKKEPCSISLSLGLTEQRFDDRIRQYFPLLPNIYFFHTLDRNKRPKRVNIKCPINIKSLKYNGVIVIASQSLEALPQSTSTPSQASRLNVSPGENSFFYMALSTQTIVAMLKDQTCIYVLLICSALPQSTSTPSQASRLNVSPALPQSTSTPSQASRLNVSPALPQSTSTPSQASRINVSPESRPRICGVCGCTYIENCIRCEQDLEYEESIRADRAADIHNSNYDVESDNENTPLCSEDLRAARVAFLTKNSTASNNTFGNDEVERFFERSGGDIDEPEVDINYIPATSHSEFMENALSKFTAIDKKKKIIIIQRDKSKFWSVLFRQKLNLTTHAPCVRFAGEAGADAGGPLREFLTLSMKNIPLLSTMVFGEEKCLCFDANTESLIDNKYFFLGQLSALSILQNGRGPECFHPAVVRSIYGLNQPATIENVGDYEIKKTLENIQNGDYDSLLEKGISVINRSETELRRLFLSNRIVHQNYSSIHQYISGIKSICPAFTEQRAYQIMEKYFLFSDKEISYDDMVALFNYEDLDECEVGSNRFLEIQDCIVEFELFLSQVDSGEVTRNNLPLRFDQLVEFCTGVDRIPPYGFEKKIDVKFKDVSLPNASTCSLTLTIPTKELSKRMATGIHFGEGFGVV
ncbi:uncharacterized protein LOC130645038 isoform X2 [Hydractinia symbiolongicarpus]|uniref:uncharacterized protein LOC130645038 isoform X2 n=1 Tax=Hydractinia symbiolongicarpus TaxID=13093 RepID=UPI00255094CE|nr:uncharacterized protein LOC130645038 isoform X2 [Hydractinia symbiolongicarpus]